MNISFDNTEVAFRHKSDADLRKARRLFQMFSNPFLVSRGPAIANFCLSIGLPIKGLILNTLFKQFCGGENIAESQKAALRLNERGIGAILDYSIEGDSNAASHRKTQNELLSVIRYISAKSEFPFAVFKPTGIGNPEVMEKVSAEQKLNIKEQQQYDDFRLRFTELCDVSTQKQVKILIDAEDSWMQKCIDDLAYEMMEKHNRKVAIVYNTIQLYRKGRIEEIAMQIQKSRDKGYKLGFKLVRGAYMEKEALRAAELGYESPIQNSKEDTDRAYDDALRLCFDNRDIVSICAGTHNEQSTDFLCSQMENAGIAKNDERFWFAQLYGMSDHISYNLAEEGYNVAKYLPYGPVKEVLPYLSRRAIENSSVKGQAGRELTLIDKEIRRRKVLK